MKIERRLFIFVALFVWAAASQARSLKLTITAPVLLECVQFLDDEHLKPKEGVVYEYQPFNVRLSTHPRIAGVLTVSDFENSRGERVFALTLNLDKLCANWGFATIDLEVVGAGAVFEEEIRKKKFFKSEQMYVVIKGTTVEIYTSIAPDDLKAIRNSENRQ